MWRPCCVGLPRRSELWSQWGKTGQSMKPISKWPASGNTFIGLLTAKVTRWTSRSLPSGIWLRLGVFWSAPSIFMTCPKKSPLTRVEQTQPPLKESWLIAALVSCCANANTSTTSSRKTTRPSNGSPDRCSCSSHSGVLESSSQGIETMLMIRKGRADFSNGSNMSAAQQLYGLAF